MDRTRSGNRRGVAPSSDPVETHAAALDQLTREEELEFRRQRLAQDQAALAQIEREEAERQQQQQDEYTEDGSYDSTASSTQQVSAPPAVDGEPEIALIMRVSMDHGQVDLAVPRGADPIDLAIQFCQAQGLDEDKVESLALSIEQHLEMLAETEREQEAERQEAASSQQPVSPAKEDVETRRRKQHEAEQEAERREEEDELRRQQREEEERIQIETQQQQQQQSSDDQPQEDDDGEYEYEEVEVEVSDYGSQQSGHQSGRHSSHHSQHELQQEEDQPQEEEQQQDEHEYDQQEDEPPQTHRSIPNTVRARPTKSPCTSEYSQARTSGRSRSTSRQPPSTQRSHSQQPSQSHSRTHGPTTPRASRRGHLDPALYEGIPNINRHSIDLLNRSARKAKAAAERSQSVDRESSSARLRSSRVRSSRSRSTSRSQGGARRRPSTMVDPEESDSQPPTARSTTSSISRPYTGSYASRVATTPFHHRLHAEAEARRAHLEKLKQQLEEEYLDSIKTKMVLNKSRQLAAVRVQDSRPIGERLYEDGLKLKERREKAHEEHLVEQEAAEYAQTYSFHPEISDYAKGIKREGDYNYERITDFTGAEAAARKEKARLEAQAAAEALEVASYHPHVNERSLELVALRAKREAEERLARLKEAQAKGEPLLLLEAEEKTTGAPTHERLYADSDPNTAAKRRAELLAKHQKQHSFKPTIHPHHPFSATLQPPTHPFPPVGPYDTPARVLAIYSDSCTRQRRALVTGMAQVLQLQPAAGAWQVQPDGSVLWKAHSTTDDSLPPEVVTLSARRFQRAKDVFSVLDLSRTGVLDASCMSRIASLHTSDQGVIYGLLRRLGEVQRIDRAKLRAEESGMSLERAMAYMTEKEHREGGTPPPCFALLFSDFLHLFRFELAVLLKHGFKYDLLTPEAGDLNELHLHPERATPIIGGSHTASRANSRRGSFHQSPVFQTPTAASSSIAPIPIDSTSSSRHQSRRSSRPGSRSSSRPTSRRTSIDHGSHTGPYIPSAKSAASSTTDGYDGADDPDVVSERLRLAYEHQLTQHARDQQRQERYEQQLEFNQRRQQQLQQHSVQRLGREDEYKQQTQLPPFAPDASGNMVAASASSTDPLITSPGSTSAVNSLMALANMELTGGSTDSNQEEEEQSLELQQSSSPSTAYRHPPPSQSSTDLQEAGFDSLAPLRHHFQSFRSPPGPTLPPPPQQAQGPPPPQPRYLPPREVYGPPLTYRPEVSLASSKLVAERRSHPIEPNELHDQQPRYLQRTVYGPPATYQPHISAASSALAEKSRQRIPGRPIHDQLYADATSRRHAKEFRIQTDRMGQTVKLEQEFRSPYNK